MLIGILALIGMIAALQIHFVLAFGAFLLMFVSTVVVERNLRKMGRVGLEKVTGSVRSRQVGQNLGGFGERMRGRFKRESD